MYFNEKTNKKGQPTWRGQLNGVTGKWCYLNKPSTKFAKTEHDAAYEVTLSFAGDDPRLPALREEVETMVGKAFDALREDVRKDKRAKLQRSSPLRPEVDKEGNETGRWNMRCKARAYRKDPASGEFVFQPLPVVGADLKPIRELVYSGAKLNIKLNLAPYYTDLTNEVGLTAYIDAVQVVQNGSATFDALSGFEDLTAKQFEAAGIEGYSGQQGENPFG